MYHSNANPSDNFQLLLAKSFGFCEHKLHSHQTCFQPQQVPVFNEKVCSCWQNEAIIRRSYVSVVFSIHSAALKWPKRKKESINAALKQTVN